ncbi:SNARE domain protein [Penicillium canariense]|uniref:SNARE domain protein n=1 Tax=Penicillium canariense TaxID=189055 RepID=A0A9W9I3T6_9EURO|nr:SNARE domain protein [Penicillium canariense]KAJ5166263.1 SNARE domain protein [Penicillium canariense]
MNDYSRDVELGQEQYALQDRSNMSAVLRKRRKVNQELQHIAQKRGQLHPAQQALLDSTTSQQDYDAGVRIGSIKEEIAGSFQRVRGIVAELKRDADMTNPRIQEQVQLTSENVQRQIQAYIQAQRDFEDKLRSQVRRRYEIAHQDATPEEVTAGVENIIHGGEQAFKVHGMRTAQATEIQNAVSQRSAAIRKIEQDLLTLSEMYHDVGALVEQQARPVQNIEQKADITYQNNKKANEHLSKAIISLRNANKYKWWILLVCILIVAIIVAAYFGALCSTGHCPGQ